MIWRISWTCSLDYPLILLMQAYKFLIRNYIDWIEVVWFPLRGPSKKFWFFKLWYESLLNYLMLWFNFWLKLDVSAPKFSWSLKMSLMSHILSMVSSNPILIEVVGFLKSWITIFKKSLLILSCSLRSLTELDPIF